MSLEKYFASEAEMLEFLQESEDQDRRVFAEVRPMTPADLEKARVDFAKVFRDHMAKRRPAKVLHTRFIPRNSKTREYGAVFKVKP